MDYYMLSTYQHDFNEESINNRNRPFPQNVAAPADINPPSEFYRAPARLDPNDPFRPRDLEGYEYEQRGRPERKRPLKRGEEWIPGRRYENYDAPMTDRGDYRIQERNVFDEERGRNGSPDRALYDRGRRRDDDKDRSQSKVKDMNDNTQMYSDRDRVRHTSIDRYYDQGRDFSPQRQAPQRYYDRYTNKYIYPDWFERPAPREIDPLADSGRFNDRTTYKDYGEFLEQRIKDEGRRRNEIDLPANPTAAHGGVYLFIRTKAGAFHQIGDALKRNRNILSISGGKLKGIAMPHQIHLIEGSSEGWTDNSPGNRIVNMLCVLWFNSVEHAKDWLEYHPQFKISAFPDLTGCDIFVAPINWQPNELQYRTYLLMEFWGVSEQFKSRIREILQRHQSRSKGYFVVQTSGIRQLRGEWMKRNALVTCHIFPSSDAAEEFLRDKEYTDLVREMKMTYGTGTRAVLFTVDLLY